MYSASSRTAVFRPDSEKSALSRPAIGRGRAEALQVSIARALLHLGPAGIRQAEKFRGLVEGFADRIVECRAEPDVIADAAHGDDLRVSAGRQKQAIGKRRVVDEPRRQRVGFEMIDGNQRLARHQRYGLGRRQSDDDAANESGSGGSGNAVDVGDAAAGVAQGFAR